MRAGSRQREGLVGCNQLCHHAHWRYWSRQPGTGELKLNEKTENLYTVTVMVTDKSWYLYTVTVI